MILLLALDSRALCPPGLLEERRLIEARGRAPGGKRIPQPACASPFAHGYLEPTAGGRHLDRAQAPVPSADGDAADRTDVVLVIFWCLQVMAQLDSAK